MSIIDSILLQPSNFSLGALDSQGKASKEMGHIADRRDTYTFRPQRAASGPVC